MAKRKRLEMPSEPIPADLETKSAFPAPRARMPIADVAGETAGRAALEEVAREMTAAEDEGRVVKKLPLDKIAIHHLARDRMVLDEEEMEALQTSLSERGQQTPIEVVTLGEGYGLISGLRRVEALKRLGESHVLALVKQPETSQVAYQAMVEENEIRAGLSFYERANIAVAAVGQGVYPDAKAAVKGLFANAPKTKRSKILKFVTVAEDLGQVLRFPTSIPEHLGASLGRALEAQPTLANGLRVALKTAEPETPADERRVLENALKTPKPAKPARQALGPNIWLEPGAGRVVLGGKAVDDAFLGDLAEWVKGRL